MGLKSSILVVMTCFLFFFSTARATLTIGRVLNKFPEFSNFTDLLNQTGLIKEINARETITILAVQNSAMGGIASRPLDVLKRILSTHVILDYYDVPKLAQLSRKSTMTTTLYQSSGIANNNQGFLNITSTPQGKIGFGSAVKGSPIDVKLEKLVLSQPYNISVLQVSGIIYTPGIDGTLAAPPRSPTPAPGPKTKKAPSPASNSDEGDDYNAEPSLAPEASTPAESPEDAPAGAPEADADVPAADSTPDAPVPGKSSAMSLCSGFMSGLVLTLVSSLAAL